MTNTEILAECLEDLEEYGLPICVGKWISGSGGHILFGGCNKVATWWHPGDNAATCDEHYNDHLQLHEAPWAELEREIASLKASK